MQQKIVFVGCVCVGVFMVGKSIKTYLDTKKETEALIGEMELLRIKAQVEEQKKHDVFADDTRRLIRRANNFVDSIS